MKGLRFASAILVTSLTIALYLGNGLGVGGETFLLKVDIPDRSIIPTLSTTGLVPVKDLYAYVLGLGTPDVLTHLEKEGVSFKVLDSSPEGKHYYLAGLKSPDVVRDLEKTATVLFTDGRMALISVSADQLIHLDTKRAMLVRLTLTPVVLIAERLAIEDKITAAGGKHPLITQAVAAVSQTSIQDYIQTLQDFTTRNSLTTGAQNAATYIKNTFESFGLTTTTQSFADGYSKNVIATLPGVISNRTYIICAHYDATAGSPYTPESEAPGADDNGSGAAAVLEAARVITKYFEDEDLVSGIKFICFSGEEQGLLGSKHYAQNATDTKGVINLDMIAYVDASPESLEVYGNANSQNLVDDFKDIEDHYCGLETRKRIDASMVYSDHSSFWDQGYKALLGIEDFFPPNPYFHTTDDVIDHLTLSFEKEVVQASVAAILELASGDLVWIKDTASDDGTLPSVTPPPSAGRWPTFWASPDIWSVPSQPEAGETVTLHARFRNFASTDVTVKVTFYVADPSVTLSADPGQAEMLGDVYMPVSGETGEAEMEWETPAGGNSAGQNHWCIIVKVEVWAPPGERTYDGMRNPWPPYDNDVACRNFFLLPATSPASMNFGAKNPFAEVVPLYLTVDRSELLPGWSASIDAPESTAIYMAPEESLGVVLTIVAPDTAELGSLAAASVSGVLLPSTGDTLGGGIYAWAAVQSSVAWADDFDDGDISDWTITVVGDPGAQADLDSSTCVSAPASLGVTGNAGSGMGVRCESPSVPIDLNSDYRISVEFRYSDFHWDRFLMFGHARLLLDYPGLPMLFDPTGDNNFVGNTLGGPFNSYVPPDSWRLIQVDVSPSLYMYTVSIGDSLGSSMVELGTVTFDPALVPLDHVFLEDNGSSSNYLDANYDDFQVKTVSTTLSVEPRVAGPAAQQALLRCLPNPFSSRTGTTVSFYMPGDGDVELKVFDMSGRVVASLVGGHMSKGWNKLDWDGRGFGGARLPSGVYVIEVKGTGVTAAAKVVVVE